MIKHIFFIRVWGVDISLFCVLNTTVRKLGVSSSGAGGKQTTLVLVTKFRLVTTNHVTTNNRVVHFKDWHFKK